MLTLTLTVAFGLYILGPELVARSIMGYGLKALKEKEVKLSQSEEIARALMFSAIPILIAYIWATRMGNLWKAGNLHDLSLTYTGLSSESWFKEHTDLFLVAAHSAMWMNFCLLWRLYFIVALVMLVRLWIFSRYLYGKHLRTGGVLSSFFRQLPGVLPRLSEWQVLLSSYRVPPGPFYLFLDIIAKSGRCYRGRLQDKSISDQGVLLSVTITEASWITPEEFGHESQEAENERKKPIFGQTVIIFTADIEALDIRVRKLRPWSGLDSLVRRL